MTTSSTSPRPTHALRPLFEPESVAVIGASANPEKRGHQVVVALEASGFRGRIFPVHPGGGELLGLPVYESVEALPVAPDLAYVATPAASVPTVVAACGHRGIKGAIVPAVGFRESGASGAALEEALLRASRETGIRVIGPNTSGLLNTHIGLHMVGGEPLPAGGLAIVAQSGNIALDLMTSASSRPIGVSIYVGPGNETDIGFHEYLEFLGEHEPTKAIALYLEGVRDGRALFETARRVSRIKPVVVLKGGRSESGERAARSHTGAIAGSYPTFRALARTAGVIEVQRADELLPVAETLGMQPGFGPGGLCVLSDGGGHATLAADHLAAAGVPLARLEEATRIKLAELLGPAASVTNPVDVAGATDRAPLVFVEAFRLLASDPSCGGILVIGLFGGYAIRFSSGLAADELEAADGVADIASDVGVPLVVYSLYERRDPPPLVRLLQRRVPVFGSLEIAVRAVVELYHRAHARTERAETTLDASRPGTSAPEPIQGRWLSERETRDLLESYGVPLVAATFCEDAEQASAAAAVHGSSALKLVSRHVPHKTEAGAVALDLVGPEEVANAFAVATESTISFLAARDLPLEIEGALVSAMQPKPVVELLIGARRDPLYGPTVTVAIGGTEVELYGDVAIRAAPVEAAEVEEMCRELELAPLLMGHRGRPAVDLAAIAHIVQRVGSCLIEHEHLSEIELNPVFAYPDHAVAIDATAFSSAS